MAADVEAILFEVVAEKTGYPREVLDASMELEADLGVDSIKRVEILAAVQDRLPDAPPVGPEQLAALRTLGQVAAYLNASTPAVAPPRPVQAPGPKPDPQPTLDRWVVRAGPAPEATAEPRLHVGEVWVVGAEGGLARGVVARLCQGGVNARAIDPADVAAEGLPDRLGGLVLIGVRPNEAFAAIRRASPSLRRTPGSFLATVARLDGRFGLDGLGAVDPGQGGLAGLAKTAGREWPEVRCRAFDLDPSLGSPAAESLLAAALLADGPDELGLRADGATTPTLEAQSPPTTPAPPIGPGELVVVAGGARGVTLEAAVALAAAWRPSMLILGRSPAPTAEPAWLAPLVDEAAIKRSLMDRANGHGTPRLIGDQFRSVAANREVAAGLARVEAAGAAVMYRSVDVRDADAVAAAIAEARARFGPVRALVHGAGVLADRRIEDLDDAGFAEVHATKVIGLDNLLAAVGPDPLRALGLFSSTTARLGRSGQVAYASANEILNKRAQVERTRRPDCRVAAINWGPWDGGMVSPGLKPLFEAEGIALIRLEAGARLLVDELSRSPAEPTEVVVLGAGSRLPEPRPTPAVGEEPTTASLAVAFERLVEPSTLPILRSHLIDGKPVLPMALILEWLAQAALRRNPGLAFLGIDDLRLMKGVVLADEKPAEVKVYAGKAVRVGSSYAVEVELRGAGRDGRELRHARGVVMLGDKLDAPPAGPGLDAEDLPAPGPIDLYPGTLFHGPALRAIERVDGLGAAGIAARVASAPPPSAWDALALRTTWLADPMALDGAFQMLIVWCRQRRGAGSLPTRLGRYRQFARSFPAEGVRVVARVVESGPHKTLADIEFRDDAGRLVARIDDYECVVDASLNRAFRRPLAAGADPR